jgi:hypothetical protein
MCGIYEHTEMEGLHINVQVTFHVVEESTIADRT